MGTSEGTKHCDEIRNMEHPVWSDMMKLAPVEVEEPTPGMTSTARSELGW